MVRMMVMVMVQVQNGLRWLRILSLLLFLPLTASAQISEKYNTDHPLVYEDAWDLWPYTYLNDNGDPEGYNIDLLKLLCKELDIPYVIKLKPTIGALEDLRDGKSDLMLGMAADFHDEYGHYSKTVVQLFTHSVVYPTSKPLLVKTMNDLASHRVIVHAGAFSHHLMQDKGWGANAVPYDDMKEAMVVTAEKQDKPIVWNTLSLKWLMHRFNIQNMEIAPIDIPHGEYRFMSNDDELLEALDATYLKLQANDQLQSIQNKWFYPEREETGVAPWVWNAAAVLAIIALVTLVYFLILHLREKNMTKLIAKENSRLALILQTSNVRIWTYNVAKQRFTWIKQGHTSEKVYEKSEFGKRYSAEDFERLCKALQQVAEEEVEKASIELKVYKANDKDANEPSDCVTNLSVLRYDKYGMPAIIIAADVDVTKERARQKNTRELMQRYQSVFETAMVDMAYYDKNGFIIDMNQKCRETFHHSLEDLRARSIPLMKIIDLDNVDDGKFDYFHATIQLNATKENRIADNDKKAELIFYELQLLPVYSAGKTLIGYYGTGRDVTEVAKNYRTLQHNIKNLEKATAQIKSYIDNINYALRVGGVRIVNYSPDSHQMIIFSETNKEMVTLTQARSLHFCKEESKRSVSRALEAMDNRLDKAIKAEVKTILHDWRGLVLVLQLHLIPTYGKDGRVTGYFGICRDISDIKQTEQQLEAETAKAQEIENVKNSFLHNMSYEIRTPLNTVVGFAELFQMPHSAEDEAIFIDQIKVNSRKLLNLVNNILFLSRLDARMIEFSTQPTDFAASFEVHCHNGWTPYKKPGVDYIIDRSYRHFITDVDDTNLGIVIVNIVANAAQFTDKGSVHASYGYTGDYLVITVEDTGCGIPEPELSHIFERFATGANNGTGLGLSICYELVHQMGGSINIKSEVGKGTTVWVTIPCQVSEIER